MYFTNYASPYIIKVNKAPPKLPKSPSYGLYRKHDGSIFSDPIESEIVHLIFTEYLAGASLGKISQILSKKNISSPTGKPVWGRSTIDKLLSNRMYISTILPAELFQQAQFEKERRSNQIQTENGAVRKATRYSSNHVLSGLLLCADCGSPYWRVTRDGRPTFWICSLKSREGAAACPESLNLNESFIMEQLADLFTSYGRLKDGIRHIRVHTNGQLEAVFEPKLSMAF